MTEQTENKPDWKRVAFVVLFWVIFHFTQMVAALVSLAQCLFLLIMREPNAPLLSFGESLSQYIHAIMLYVTLNSDERPFPFADFPKAADLSD